ncbi:MAG: aldolase/citrate lyase family protein [Chloroflexi bacterium]|nr:aldolase/citrate lyase family protein [Chloroflexota bacterium]
MGQLRENRIKRKLERGEIVNVVEGFHTAEIIDFLGPIGFDGVWVENEHGAIDFREIQNITRSCDLWGMTSLIRVNRVDYGLIYRSLDQGAQGVIVPHVDTAEQAREVVRAARYAPIGARGMYGSRQAFGLDTTEYFKTANQETLVVVMIEDIMAIENLPEILAVDHIDVFFVAPSDLAQSMGLIGQIDHPKVKQTIFDALSRIADAGRTAGAIAWADTAEEVVEAGAKFLMTSWLPYLTVGAKTYLEAIQRVADES